MAEEPDNPNVPALAMHGVAVSSRHDPAVVVATEVNWTVRAGEFWVVAGPQQSGKSDLLMLAGGLTSPARGVYQLFGEPMPIFEDERLEHRLKLGLVFDGGQLFNRMTIAENVALPLRYHADLSRAEAGLRVREMLEQMELAAVAQSLPARVGRNWQKRAGLARALMLEPSVLLVDNPLGGLDARHAAWWLSFLEQLHTGHSFMAGQPMTVVVATDELPRLAGSLRKDCRFAVMNEGRFRVVGDREELFASRDPGIQELLVGGESTRAN